MKEKLRSKGITLIALIITIIVLLLIAGITISALTGSHGILRVVSEAKIQTAVGAVKEAIELEKAEKIIDRQEVSPETLLVEGKVKRIIQEEDGIYYMYYVLKENAYEGMQGLGKGNITRLRDVFLIDDDLNIKYIANNGKEYGYNINNKILEDETNIRFASKSFSEYISNKIGVTEDKIKFEWMKNQTSLDILDPTVDSLQDLVFFPNLTTLRLGTSNSNAPQITSMDGIENCTKLTTLDIYNGPSKDYSALSKLPNLTNFKRIGNGADFDNIIDVLKHCASIETLDLSWMNLDDLSKIPTLKKLRSLTVSYNYINKISGLEEMTNLESLNLYRNDITKVEGLENLTNLKTLDLSFNKIEDITPLSKNSNSLTTIKLNDNPFDGNRSNYTGERLEALNKIGEIIDRGGTINLDIKQIGLFTNYKKLTINNKNISTLKDFDGLTELTSLTLSSNQITLADKESQEILKSMTKLTSLNLSSNKLTDISAINNLKKLTILDLGGNSNVVNLVQIQDILPNLVILRVSTETLKTIVNCDVDKIVNLPLSYSGLTELPDLSKFVKLKCLILTGNPNIKNLSIISQIVNLNELHLENVNLHGRMIDFSKLTNLTNLNLRNNSLWSEDLENLKALKNNTKLNIDLSNNSIIDASALLELNPNTRIDLTKNVNLSAASKQLLTERFGSNVKYDR